MSKRALLACLATSLLLTGCLQTRTEKLGSGHFRLQAPYDTREELAQTLARHEAKAKELCPEGYNKRKDYDRRDGGSATLVWEISCDRAYQREIEGRQRAVGAL